MQWFSLPIIYDETVDCAPAQSKVKQDVKQDERQDTEKSVVHTKDEVRSCETNINCSVRTQTGSKIGPVQCFSLPKFIDETADSETCKRAAEKKLAQGFSLPVLFEPEDELTQARKTDNATDSCKTNINCSLPPAKVALHERALSCAPTQSKEKQKAKQDERQDTEKSVA